MVQSRISILLLCDDHRGHANTVLDHINAFLNLSRHKVYKYNPRDLPFNYCLDLNEFGVVVIHYSLPIISDHYISPDLRQKIHRFQGLKIQYIQDDYRQVDQYTAMMRFLGIRVLFTPYPPEKIPHIYDENRLPGVMKMTTLTGYIPERHRKVVAPPLENRPIDVGYRGRDIPYWLGTLGQEKAWIGEGFLKHAAPYGLNCDIGWKENDRIYGKRWDRFISSCKAMLGTESGVSITDFDGSIEIRTKEYLAIHPQADFREVYEKVLEPYEGNLIENTISPRVFEYAVHRTAMILFPGEYSGILQPWVHYIPLQKDFSNMDEVVARLRDKDFLNALVERAYNELIISGKYSCWAMTREFDGVVERFFNSVLQPNNRLKIRFRLARVERLIVGNLLRPSLNLERRIYYFLHHLVYLVQTFLKKAAKRILSKSAYEQLRDYAEKHCRKL